MAKEDGSPDLVSGEDLGVYLRDELRLLRLVFLNACKTAATSARAASIRSPGVATSLIQAGVPAVVAMQFPISDKAAVTFSETFYQSIAKGDPVDVAMAEGRKKLWHLEEWATPVLFLRSKDGVLFEPRERQHGRRGRCAARDCGGNRGARRRSVGRRARRMRRACSSRRRAKRWHASHKQLAKKLRELGRPRRRRGAARRSRRRMPRRCSAWSAAPISRFICSAIIPAARSTRTNRLAPHVSAAGAEHRDRGRAVAAGAHPRHGRPRAAR